MSVRRILIAVVGCLVVARGADAAKKKKTPDAPLGMFSVPAAVMPGAATQVTFYNRIAGKPTGLWTSFAAEVTDLPESDSGNTRYKIAVAADVPVGIYAVRLGTTEGASDLQLFMVDDLPSVRRGGKNIDPAHAQSLKLPVAVDGECEAIQSDYYRFAAHKGQHISFEVVAQRLGFRLDPVVRILDSAGRELAYVDDTPGIGSDCRFACTFEADGEYLIELHDAEYSGGVDRRYRLRVGDFPAVTVAFPIGGKRGVPGTFQFEGANGVKTGPVTIQLASAVPRQWLGVKAPGGKSSAFVSVLCGDADELIATAPNHSRKTATPISVPVTISGRFLADSTDQRNFYAFEGKKDQRLTVRARTQSIGSRCNLLLEVINAQGTRVVASKPQEADEGQLDVMIPANGQYYLATSELTGAGGPGVVYRLEIEPVKPGFSLAVDLAKIDAVSGGTFPLKVKCGRRNYEGPIMLAFDEAAKGFELKNAVIAAGKNEADLEVKLPAGLMPGRPLAFTLLGKATIGGAECTERASTLTALKAIFPRLANPPMEFDGLIAIGVRVSQ